MRILFPIYFFDDPYGDRSRLIGTMKHMTIQRIRASGFVLAGGESHRMGSDKASMRLNGEPLALRAARLLRGIMEDVALLGDARRYQHMEFPVIPDPVAFQGPLAALCAGLASSKHEWSLFLACDMPNVEAKLLRALVARTGSAAALEDAVGQSRAPAKAGAKAQVIVPLINGRLEPLCAVYHRSCLPSMQSDLANGQRSVRKILERLDLDAVPASQLGDHDYCERVFQNVNTVADWKQLLAQRGSADENLG